MPPRPTRAALFDRLDELLRDHPWWPQITLTEVGSAIDDLFAYTARHRQFIVAHGLPPTPAPSPSSLWLYRRLGSLYDTRATSSPEPMPPVGSGPTRPPYTWVRLRSDLPAGSAAPPPAGGTPPGVRIGRWTSVDHTREADPLGGLTEADARRVERDRPRLFRFKTRVLGFIREAIGGDRRPGPERAAELRTACLDAVGSAFTPAQLRFYLQIDRRRRGEDAGGGYHHHTPTPYPPGGLSDLLELVGEVEVELRERCSGRLHDLLRPSLLTALREQWGLPPEANAVELTDGPRVKLPVATPDSPHAVGQHLIKEAVQVAEAAASRRWHWGLAYKDTLAAALTARFQRPAEVLFGTRHVERQADLVREYDVYLARRARQAASLDTPFAPGDVPYWDPGSRHLYFQGRRVAQFRKLTKTGADHLGQILEAFQQACWPEAIPDPLPPLKAGSADDRRKDKVDSLNAGVRGGELRFGRHAGGFRWRRGD